MASSSSAFERQRDFQKTGFASISAALRIEEARKREAAPLTAEEAARVASLYADGIEQLSRGLAAFRDADFTAEQRRSADYDRAAVLDAKMARNVEQCRERLDEILSITTMAAAGANPTAGTPVTMPSGVAKPGGTKSGVVDGKSGSKVKPLGERKQKPGVPSTSIVGAKTRTPSDSSSREPAPRQTAAPPPPPSKRTVIPPPHPPSSRRIAAPLPAPLPGGRGRATNNNKSAVDPKLAEIIRGEIVDGGSPVTFDDVSGQDKAKQALR